MPVIKIDLDDNTFQRLADRADLERRAPVGQAEVMLRKALGIPTPSPARDKPSAGGMPVRNAR